MCGPISSPDLEALESIVVKAASFKHQFGDKRSSSSGPTALFAASDLRYAPIVSRSSLASSVPEFDDAALRALVDSGINAGYFQVEGAGVIVTFAGHRHARNILYQMRMANRIYFEDLSQTNISLGEAILLHVSDDEIRHYPVWFGELDVTFPNAGRQALEASIRTLRAKNLIESEAVARNLSSVPFHIDDVELTPIATADGNRAAALLRRRDDVRILMRPLQHHTNTASAKAIKQRPRIFIGHGQAADWRELKDFIEGTLEFEVVEYNAVPTAGVATKERLEEMLDTSAFAFIVATAEDYFADGSIHARENVVHEIGLFQGRLGFNNAIVVLEVGCNEFSNIVGVGQLRFKKKDIRSTFGEVHGLLKTRLLESTK